MAVRVNTTGTSGNSMANVAVGADVAFSRCDRTIRVPMFSSIIGPVAISSGKANCVAGKMAVARASIPDGMTLTVSAPRNLGDLGISLGAGGDGFASLLGCVTTNMAGIANVRLLATARDVFPAGPALKVRGCGLSFATFLSVTGACVKARAFAVAVASGTRRARFTALIIAAGRTRRRNKNRNNRSTPVVAVPRSLIVARDTTVAAAIITSTVVGTPGKVGDVIIGVMSNDANFARTLRTLLMERRRSKNPMSFVGNRSLINGSTMTDMLTNIGGPATVPATNTARCAFPVNGFTLFVTMAKDGAAPRRFRVRLASGSNGITGDICGVALASWG